jgi:dienelactone hydrolase
MGHSYGGFMTNLLITHPDRCRAASGAGISNWFGLRHGRYLLHQGRILRRAVAGRGHQADDHAIAAYEGKVRTPTLFINGEMDQRVPYEEGEQIYFALRRQGVPARMILHAGQPHGISGHWNNVHRMLNELHWIDTMSRKDATRRHLRRGSSSQSGQPDAMQAIARCDRFDSGAAGRGRVERTIPGALFAALGMTPTRARSWGSGALDQSEVVAAQHRERLEDSLGSAFAVEPLGPEILIESGNWRPILREDQPHPPSPHHLRVGEVAARARPTTCRALRVCAASGVSVATVSPRPRRFSKHIERRTVADKPGELRPHIDCEAPVNPWKYSKTDISTAPGTGHLRHLRH